MVDTIPPPTTLEIYFCENCNGIIASTDLTQLNFPSDFHCPFCSEDSLVLLPKSDYQANFNLELFPHPQNILLQTFFQNTDDTSQLLGIFSQVGILSLLPDKMGIMSPLEHTHILISPMLIIEVQLDRGDGYYATLTSKEINDISALISET